MSFSFVSFFDEEKDIPDQISSFITQYERYQKMNQKDSNLEPFKLQFQGPNLSASTSPNPQIKPQNIPAAPQSMALSSRTLNLSSPLFSQIPIYEDTIKSPPPAATPKKQIPPPQPPMISNTVTQSVIYSMRTSSQCKKTNEKPEEYFKVVEHQKHSFVEQFTSKLASVQNKEVFEAAFASFNINSFVQNKEKQSDNDITDLFIQALSPQNSELVFHTHNSKFSFQQLCSLSEQDKKMYESLINIFIETKEFVQEILGNVTSKIHEMRLNVLKNSLEQEIDNALLMNNLIRFPLFLEGVHETIHQLSIEKSLEQFEQIVQQIGLMRTYTLYGKRSFDFSNPINETSYIAFASKYETKKRSNKNQSQQMKPAHARERKDKCAQTLSLLKHTNFNIQLIYSVIIQAMKELTPPDDSLAVEALIASNVTYMKDYQNFLLTYVFNKQRFNSTFGKEENQYISQFMNAVNQFLV